MKSLAFSFLVVGCLAICTGCVTTQSGAHTADTRVRALLDPNGSFVVYVSNQSFAIDPVDIQVQIDGEVVVRQEFEVGNQHSWQVFRLALSHGKHTLNVTSSKGEASLIQDFEVKGKHWAVIAYWYYPESHYSPTPRSFSFHIRDEPIEFL